MNKRTLLVNGLAITAITLGVGSYSAFAAQGGPAEEGQGPDREAIHASFEANDYATFSELTADGPRGEVDEATFSVLAQAYELRESGDKEAARELLEANDIERPRRHRRGAGEDGERPQRRGNEEARAALEAGDYSAWAEALAEKPNAEEFVSEDTFNTLTQAHALREAGDGEAARALLEGAGIRPPQRGQRGGTR